MWDDLPDEERCPTCGQPDNCGDCNHRTLPSEHALEQTLTPAPKSDVRSMRRMDMQHGTTTVITLRRRHVGAKTGDSHLEFSHVLGVLWRSWRGGWVA
jgi:hypothetical protein